MLTTEFHTYISLNPTYAIMARFLVASIATNANLPASWKMIFTVSRDTTWGFDVPELA